MQSLQLGSPTSAHLCQTMLGSPHSHPEAAAFPSSPGAAQSGYGSDYHRYLNGEFSRAANGGRKVLGGLADISKGQPASGVVRCCDPYNQKVYDVPYQYVEDTLGKHTYSNNPSGRRAQICMKYQDGQCNMKTRCQQIHAERGWISELRSRFYDSRKVYVSDILAVDPETGDTIAFKYSEVDSCQAKDAYRNLPTSHRAGFTLCTEYLVGNTCRKGRNCNQLHVSADKYQKALQAAAESRMRSPVSPRSPVGMSPGMHPKTFDQIPTSPMSQYCIPQNATNLNGYINCSVGQWCPAAPLSPSSDRGGMQQGEYYYYPEYQNGHPMSPVEGYMGVPSSPFIIQPPLCEKGTPVTVTLEHPGTGRGRERTQSASSTPNSRSRSAPPPEHGRGEVLEQVAETLCMTRRGSGGRSRSLMAHVERD
eukprot:TRINITY_DN13710_c0_g1_i1.p1 TRINITY_DN13710_c0_g1~~TRINITY_DN13710_c0_g1_i1.p1  ORF type:complete len:421 (+),score=20.14 TRINITY_DN13710_c0_g1_i1:186-1448(+)